MEEFCSGMPPSYCQLELESTASHKAAAGRLKHGDGAARKPEFRLPFLPDLSKQFQEKKDEAAYWEHSHRTLTSSA
jgi:hypothetical protein